MDYVSAGLRQGECTLHAHTEFTVCLTVAGSDSAGQCAYASEPHTALVYFPYRPGETYIATGKGCMNTLQGSASPAAPATLCQDIPASRVTL